jgi:valyl-tRNA synthetase
VPVKAHPLADPEKGSGIAMICTFGDITDVTWWRELIAAGRAVHSGERHAAAVAWGSRVGVGRPAAAQRATTARRPSVDQGRARPSSKLAEEPATARRAAPITHA